MNNNTELLLDLWILSRAIDEAMTPAEFNKLSIKKGITSSDYEKIEALGNSVFESEEELVELLKEKVVDMYMEKVKKLRIDTSTMAKGYEEMGELDQNEEHLWSKEGKMNNEMDTKKS